MKFRDGTAAIVLLALAIVVIVCAAQYALYYGIAGTIFYKESAFEKSIGKRVRGRTLSDAIAIVEAAGRYAIVPAPEGTPCPRRATQPPTVVLEVGKFTGLVTRVNLCTGEHVETDLRSDVLGY